MSDYICEKCGNECELEEIWITEYDEEINFDVSVCCKAYYYVKEDEL